MIFPCFFAMAKIQRMGHDNQVPFGHVLVVGVVVVENQAVTRGKNKLPNTQYISDSQYFYRFRTPYKTRPRQSVPNSVFYLVGPGLILVNLV